MRVTRAALRAQTSDEAPLIHEDSDCTQDADTSQSENGNRPVLKDITDDTISNAATVADAENSVLEKKSKGGKRSKVSKKGRLEQPEAIEQEGITKTSENNGDNSNSPSKSQDTVSTSEDGFVVVDVTALDTSLSKAARTTYVTDLSDQHQTPVKDVTTSLKTPKFDPLVHGVLESINAEDDSKEDSFVDSIKSRSPAKMNVDSPAMDTSQDSFVEHVRTRTPAKLSPRIEDSVTAIDALEDAIEQISESLPLLNPASSVKMPGKTPVKGLPPSARKTALDTTIVTKSPHLTRKSPSKPQGAAVRPAPQKTASGRISTVAPTRKAPLITKSNSRPSAAVSTTKISASKPDISFSKSPAKQQPSTLTKRSTSGVLSTSKAAFVPAKSTKPPTKASFSLPGEAIAAKLKAQREERQKREGEQSENKDLKARPIPPRLSRPSVAPRMTKTTTARLSLVTDGSDKENTAPKPKGSSAKPLIGVTVTKTRPDLNKANASVRRTTSEDKTGAVPRISIAPRVSSLSAGQRSVVTKEDAAQQKVRGREVFGRTKAEMDKVAQERKEKEEAARKARLEAAERGRQASREWAEKQKQKHKKVASKTQVAASDAVAPFATAVL